MRIQTCPVLRVVRTPAVLVTRWYGVSERDTEVGRGKRMSKGEARICLEVDKHAGEP
jgi:hypothetical protein